MSAAMDTNDSSRSGLVHRQIPRMTLSAGDETSNTAPPQPIPHYLDSTGRALYRFAVEGNAVITGGAGNLALECAKALLDHGLAGLALWDIAFDHAEKALDDLKKDYPAAKIATIDVDVRDPASVEMAHQATAQTFGVINLLCCFAGVVGAVPSISARAEEWQRLMDINCGGTFLCAQAVARGMIANKTGGSIVFIASISGHTVNFPQPQAAYNVSKAGVIHLARSLAAEWAVEGIRVNSISPGYFDTILNEGEGLASLRKLWRERTPLGRLGQPQELQSPLVMLCSQAGSFITGADIKVDGGLSVF